MGSCRYGVSLQVFNVELNTRREILYLQATMYYFVYCVNTDSPLLTRKLVLGPGRTRANFVYFQFLARKKLAKISQGPNFGGGRIGPTCLSQNFAD